MESVGSMSQLERMGSELKCPICLSLYKDAATISCNHSFCRSCILESIRATACCPICKAHSTRREVRSAPQMDTLVEIFRGMESAAGICLFPTQATQVPPPEKRVAEEEKNARGRVRPKRAMAPSSKTKAASEALDPRKRRRKGKIDHSKSDDSEEDENLRVNYERAVANAPSADVQGVVLAKKRIQGPQAPQVFADLNLESEVEYDINGADDMRDNLPEEYRPPSEYWADPIPSEAAEMNSRPGMLLDLLKPAGEDVPLHHRQEISGRLAELPQGDVAEEQAQPSGLNLDLELQGFPSLRQAISELPQLSPFFWLNSDPLPTQDELPTQTQLSAQPVRPAFSDLKDSDDEGSLDDVQQPDVVHKHAFGEGEGYDSDTFEWTQRPCSPELSCSPTRFGRLDQSGRSVNHMLQGETCVQQRVVEPLRDQSIVAEVGPFRLSPRELQEAPKQRGQVVPTKGKKSLPDHNEDAPPQNMRRSSRAKTSDERAALSALRKAAVRPPISHVNATACTAADGRITKTNNPEKPQGKDCAAVASRFLDLLRDATTVVSPQPLQVEIAAETVPKAVSQPPPVSKDCAVVASRFLNLLRDATPVVAPQPPHVEVAVGTTVPKVVPKPPLLSNDAENLEPNVTRQPSPVSNDAETIAPTVQAEDSRKGEKRAGAGKSKATTGTSSTECRFCGTIGNSEVAGEMMRYQMGTSRNRHLYVHKLCAEWAPNVYFEEDNRPENLTSEISRGSRIKCAVCNKKGAALGCCNHKCKNSYHYPCARRLKGCQWKEDEYVMFCPQHARGRTPKARRQSGDSINSTLTAVVDLPTFPTQRTDARAGTRAPGAATCSGVKAEKWAPGPAQKWVLCGSGLDSQLKVQVASFASMTGATVVTKWSSAVTHVITGTDEQGAAKRTLKYLLAMLEGKWIVRMDWINECIVRKGPVAEELFLVNSDVNGFLGGPCLSRHLAATKAPKLFEGLSFFLCGDFTYVLKADLHSLVTAGGGVVLHRKPLPLPVASFSELNPALQETPRAGQTIVLYNGEPDAGRHRNLANRIQEAMSVSIPAGAYALPCSWLLDSIAHCRLLPPI